MFRAVEQPIQRADVPVLEPFRGLSINKPGQVSAPAKQYESARDDGVNLRARPDGSLPSIAKVRYGTDVQVQALDTTGAFDFVIARRVRSDGSTRTSSRSIRPTSAPTSTTSPRAT